MKFSRIFFSLSALALFAIPAHADSNLEVSVPATFLPFGGDTVSLTFDWNVTKSTFYNFDFVLDGVKQSVVETGSTIDPATGGLFVLDLTLGNGDFFQIIQRNLGAPPILPQPGTYFTALSLRFNSIGNEENAGTFSTVSALPELPTFSLLAAGLFGLAALKLKVA